ncbi:MAG: N-acetyltransferase family protein [Rhodothermales bacterium]
MLIREAAIDDFSFFKEMLYEAFFWEISAARPNYEDFQYNAEFLKHIKDWGRHDDMTLIGELSGMRIGAVWYRKWTAENHSYGFVNAHTPEIGIAVANNNRGEGVGRKLLQSILRKARLAGFPAISLSVNPRNYARKLYESEGFKCVEDSDASITMICKL